MSATKVFHKKAKIDFEYDGVTFSLPGEMPIAATLFLVEMNSRKTSGDEITTEDILRLYGALLGDDNADKLINELAASQGELEEIIRWYGEEIQRRSPTKKLNPVKAE